MYCKLFIWPKCVRVSFEVSFRVFLKIHEMYIDSDVLVCFSTFLMLYNMHVILFWCLCFVYNAPGMIGIAFELIIFIFGLFSGFVAGKHIWYAMTAVTLADWLLVIVLTCMDNHYLFSLIVELHTPFFYLMCWKTWVISRTFTVSYDRHHYGWRQCRDYLGVWELSSNREK